MSYETRLFADIMLKSMAAIVALLLFAGLMPRGQTPATHPAHQGQSSATAVALRHG
jgi:hypothetical protein